MYHRRPSEIAYIAIAAPGTDPGEIRTGPAGTRRSRDGALLKHCVADCRKWLKLEPDVEADGIKEFFLEDPDTEELERAIQQAGKYVLAQKESDYWNGGGISIWYSGHGENSTGAWSLRDGSYTAQALVEILRPIGNEAGGSLGLEVGMDSCHSGAFFAHLMEQAQDAPLAPRDMYISCLPSQASWEIDSLGHGALAFTLFHQGNAHVDSRRLAEAVKEGDTEYLRMATHAFVPNPVTYLTEADQICFELMSGHSITVEGGDGFELPEAFSASKLIDLLEAAGMTQPGEEVTSE